MKVLVTGANGHVGLNLCKALLARGGYQVRASVRALDDAAKVAPVRALGDLELVALDIHDAAQFEAALAGVETLFHVAATYALYTGSPDKDAALLRDSVEGVEVALRAAARAGVRKVVLTSSVVTLPMVAPGAAPVSEADWRTDLSVPYYRAKTEAEQKAWKLAEELGLKLVTLLPGGIGGPDFLRRTPTIDMIESIMLGSLALGAPRVNTTYVDVRDVVEGHILAAERDVTGRFLLCNEVSPTLHHLSKVMHEIDPAVPAARFVLPGFMLGLVPFFDAMNAKKMGTARTATPELVATMKKGHWHVRSDRASSELGWAPAIPERQSLADSMSALRALRRSEGKNRMA